MTPLKDIVDRLESEFQKEGAQIEQVQKMDKRQFSYVAGELDAGFYVNFIFHADSQLITKLRSKFKLDPEVYRQHYQRLREKKAAAGRKRVADDEVDPLELAHGQLQQSPPDRET